MPGMEEYNDRLDSREIILAIWSRKWFVVAFSVAAAVCSAVYSLTIPNVYESKVLLSPVEQQQQGGLSQLASQYSGIAALAGVDLGGFGGGTNKKLIAIETLKSLKFFTENLYDETLPELIAAKAWDESSGTLTFDESIYNSSANEWIITENFKKPSPLSAHKSFMDALTIDENKTTSLITLSILHVSPVVAKNWLELVVLKINEAMRLEDLEMANRSIEYLAQEELKTSVINRSQIISDLIEQETRKKMFANVNESYSFRIIDPPVIPESRKSPNRRLIVFYSTIFFGVLGTMLIILWHYGRLWFREE